MAAISRIYLGVVLLLAVAASTTSRVAAFGLPRGLRPGHCASVFRTYDTASPFMSGNTTAIHIGNTKSCVAGYGGRLDPHTAYQFCIPSWVAFTDNGTLVGEAAMNHAAVRPGTAVSGFKRLFGIRQDGRFSMVVDLDSFVDRMYNKMVKREAELVPYHFTEQLGRCGIEIEEGNVKSFLPEDVASILVAELKRTAEAHLGREIRYAMVTVPGHLNAAQRSWLVMEAAQWRGGFRTAKLVDEQVAAAAAYRLHEKRGDRKVILVFHLGGRTCHATKFRFKDGSARLLDEYHDPYLGGDDFTGRVVDYFLELIQEKHDRDIRGDDGALRKLRADCESAKKLLSDREGVLMNIGSVLGEAADVYEELTRAKFEELNRDLMERAMEIVETVVMGGAPSSHTQSRKDAIDEVILVGGSVRIPMVGQLLEDYFDGRGLIRDEDAVIRGAALLSRPESARYVDECYNGGVSGPLWLAK
ncbi:luminal-binding protein 5-like [Hordeum vulgare subsp. vulgare]|uniref:luminal-binding protein 5-like n=1 Tax=Hordeum vulgare subsp. vulgare TaxID=112509 RepID=UPI001D1A401A|nr:luminal-binding protein 5-like [Hordeum vulgare subsp. vulgare]